MRNETENPIQCAQFEALLSDALDGILAGGAHQCFEQHRAACPNCALMYTEAEAGLGLLRSLSEAEPSSNLIHNILVATVGAQTAGRAEHATHAGWRGKLTAALGPVFGPILRPMLQPRFAMSAAMAFCSLSVALSLSGVKLKQISASSFTPSALRDTTVRAYEETSARAHRYYDNLRFVYEIESRVRELKNATPQGDQPQEQQKPDNQKKPKDPNGADKEQRNRDRQYARRDGGVIEARWFAPSPLSISEKRVA